MNPLSPLTYYRRHKWTALLLLGLIILTTLGLYLMVAILDSTTLMFAEIGYLKRVSQIYPNGAPSFERGIISRVQAHPDVERVIPEKGLAILQPALVNPFDVSLLGIRQEDLPYLTDRFGLRIQKGRMLQPRTNEIMLSEEVARALGLTLGDQIDRSIDPDAYYLIRHGSS
jgi:ABC-type lipoprotein release transport system permease subunit